MSRCLLVIDVQNEYFVGKLPVTYPEYSLGSIIRAMNAAQVSGVPVVVVQHAAPLPIARCSGAEAWSGNCVRKSLSGRAAALIHKSLPGSFTGTDLEQWAARTWRRHRNDSGIHDADVLRHDRTPGGTLGFSVEFLCGATATLEGANAVGKVSAEELHRAILVTQQMRFSEVLTADQWIKRISQ